MWGHFGFSYVGLIYLAMLWIPNLLWARHLPAGYDPSGENRILRVLERTGQVLCTASILLFSDYNGRPLTCWSLWLMASCLLMLLYDWTWIRYFWGGHQLRDFYRSLWGIPVPLASLPVAAFLLLGIYGRVIWLIAAAILLGIGHIGIHLGHLRELPEQPGRGPR